MIERGDLKNRAVTESVGSERVEADIQRVKGKRKPEADPNLAERIAAARAVPMLPTQDLHCGHCFGEGRDAAIRAFEGPADGV